jgi:hypothetical protein
MLLTPAAREVANTSLLPTDGVVFMDNWQAEAHAGRIEKRSYGF